MSEEKDVDRRDFLFGSVSGIAGLAGLALGGSALAAGRGAAAPQAPAADPRTEEAYKIRVDAAERARRGKAVHHATNGDEEALPGKIACYSKGLPHNRLGEVEPRSFAVLLKALGSGKPQDFETIPLGGFVKLANPQAGLTFGLIGPDPARLDMAPPPRFESPEQGAELAELYWHSLLRDVPFADYEKDPRVAAAAADMSRLSGFKGPRDQGQVTPRTLFRGAGEGDLAGPFLSQFLLKDIFFTPIRVEQKLRIAVPAVDYLTDYDGWLACQNGGLTGVNRFDETRRYIRTGRDLGEFVHRDFTYQASLAACLILLKLGAPLDGGNPYMHSRTQSPFNTFGSPYLLFLLALVTQVSLNACWYQKWMVHRRIRPEEYAGRVENHRAGRAHYPLPAELLASGALAGVVAKTGNALLPQAYPEGCPTHPSYPAGHAVIAGAGVTVLKAFFDESFVLPAPVVPSADGLTLVPWQGPSLTVGGELDKLASNIGIARNFAGLHWRSDHAEGIKLGEEAAIQVLRELKLTGNEMFTGFSLKRFDGRRETV
jgi:hypothetical protein